MVMYAGYIAEEAAARETQNERVFRISQFVHLSIGSP